MSIIRPITQQDILTKSKLQESAQKAKLNLPEIIALNKNFGTNLEYIPESDVIEFTTYYGKEMPKMNEQFFQECANIAVDMALESHKSIENKIKIDDSAKSSFEASLNSAIKKLKSTML